MAGGGVIKAGKATILKTLPTVQASKTISAVGLTPDGVVVLTEAESLPRINPYGVHTLYVVPGLNSFTVYSSRNELPKDVTFQYLAYQPV